MLRLPPHILDSFGLATTKDIRSWSFGAIKRTRAPADAAWREVRGSLDDQAIFGPQRDFRCACGKYEGHRHSNMVCDCCGVKVAPSEIRRSRFGHIEFSVSAPHPFAASSETIDAFPVLPAAYFQSELGTSLVELYDNLVRVNKLTGAAEITTTISRICDLLVPVVIQAHDWNLQDVDTLARGLALSRKSGTDADQRCNACGYPFSGVNSGTCPGCGKPIGLA